MDYNLVDVLCHSLLFKNIVKTDVEDFLYKNTYTIKDYTKNDMLALAGDKVNYLMIVLDGSLVARMVSDSGKSVQIDRIDRGRIVAPAMLYAKCNEFPVNVSPENNVSVLYMHKDTFLKAIHENEKLLFNFIQIISDINHFLSTKIHTLTLKSIKGKLAEYLLLESEKQGDCFNIILPMSKQELADKFAVARQALSRSLSELEEYGLINVNGRKIKILNKVGLNEIN